MAAEIPFAKGRVLVTGGAGFIGSHLVEHLTAADTHVVVIDDLSTGSRENLAGVDQGRMTLIEAGVIDGLRGLEGERFDAIVHLAAAVGVRLVIDEPIRAIETNVLETTALLRFASERGMPTLIASTSEVYGKGMKTPFSEDDDVAYGPTIYSRWSYACSKAIDEYLALAHHERHDLPVVIVRFFNTVGPRQIGEYGMVLPRFVSAALAGEPIRVYGDGEQTRCFCDVRDVVPALPRLLESSPCAGRVFNIGRDEPLSIRQLAKTVKQTLESSSPIVTVPYKEAFGPGFDDLRSRQPDLGRIRQAIGFAPKIPLSQSILDLADWLRARSTAVAGGAT